jgi:hypothetical protein
MSATPTAPTPRRSLARVLVHGCLTGVLLALALHLGYILLGPNLHTVVPGRVYRSAQPTGPQLESLVHRLGIRTILNLNGCCDPLPWYIEEARASNHLNVSQVDVGLSAGRLPSVPAVRQLVEVLDHSEYPILIHCHKGIDRTGLAATLYLLLYTDLPPAEARSQLSLWRGHLSVGRTGNLDRFFDLYGEWLAAHGRQHSREAFRRWLEQDYCPGECLCALEVLEPTGEPIRVPRGRPFPVRVRCTNTSIKPWRFRPGSNAGIHAHFVIVDAQGALEAEGRAGLFDATVPPGGHIDLTLALPALYRPGRYRLRVDMADEQHAHFVQTGSEPLFRNLEVP